MLDVGLPGAGEGAARVRTINDAAHVGDYSRLYGLGVRVIVGIIRRAPILRRDSQTPPRLSRRAGDVGTAGRGVAVGKGRGALK